MLTNSVEASDLKSGKNAKSPSKWQLFLQGIWKDRLSYLFVAPFVIVFAIFILLPVLAAFGLSFTYFNGMQAPHFTGLRNYEYLFSQDLIFLKYALPNTLKFAIITGPGGLLAGFILAWLISQTSPKWRLIFTMAIYAPSMTEGTTMAMIWKPMLSGDRLGYLNSFLLKLGIINEPHLWTLNKAYLMDVMIVVTMWSNMGVGFLAMLAGLLSVDKRLYEAARIDGLTSRLQEIWYITIPSMKPQMLFAAVMAIVGAFKQGNLGVLLSGKNPTPEYAGRLIVSHIEDYGLTRFEIGYASALTVVLLLIILVANRISWKLFGIKEDE